MTSKMKPLSVYIHIPFCVRKCLYCDFLSAPAEEDVKERYVEALCAEIVAESVSYVNHEVQTVFLGGGTPSVLPAENMERILDVLRKNYRLARDCEISLEVNPGTATEDKLNLWKRAGINRLSIGLQSAVDEELKALGRIHNSQDFFQTYELAVKTGFNNINVDLMSAIPRQTVQSYEWTLRQVAELKPPPGHISAYSLIVEEGTPFYEHTPALPDEDSEREMYKITKDILIEYGYQRYEISNYAKPGYACRHNQVYWRRGEYVGFGIGAASMVKQVRFSNVRDLESYVNCFCAYQTIDSEKREERAEKSALSSEAGGIRENVSHLSVEEQMEEFMFLGLRMMSGVSEKEFQGYFGKTIDEVYPGVVEDMVQKGLMKRVLDADGEDAGGQNASRTNADGEDTGGQNVSVTNADETDIRLALTDYGIDVSNRVLAEFLLT